MWDPSLQKWSILRLPCGLQLTNHISNRYILNFQCFIANLLILSLFIASFPFSHRFIRAMIDHFWPVLQVYQIHLLFTFTKRKVALCYSMAPAFTASLSRHREISVSSLHKDTFFLNSRGWKKVVQLKLSPHVFRIKRGIMLENGPSQPGFGVYRFASNKLSRVEEVQIAPSQK